MAREIDPLPEQTREKALAAARADPELSKVLEGRSAAVFVEPNVGRDVGDEDEQALVGIYDYDNDRSLVAAVDPVRGEVLGVEETPVRFQLSREERERAEAIAQADARVAEFLNGRELNPLTRLYFPPHSSDQDAAHRYALVFARPTNEARLYAIVDLSAGAVVEVLDSLADPRAG